MHAVQEKGLDSACALFSDFKQSSKVLLAPCEARVVVVLFCSATLSVGGRSGEYRKWRFQVSWKAQIDYRNRVQRQANNANVWMIMPYRRRTEREVVRMLLWKNGSLSVPVLCIGI